MADRTAEENSTVASAPGELVLRPECDDDRAFRFDLFCRSRPPEWAQMRFEPELLATLMESQFRAQAESYRGQFPQARFDIVLLGDAPVDRIVVDRTGDRLHVVDLAILPAWRGRGIGTALLHALMKEAEAGGMPVCLGVAVGNDLALRLYRRLGFSVVAETPAQLGLEWRGP
jgi:ribosomal protein S18 acetylase RimI-like enzyme